MPRVHRVGLIATALCLLMSGCEDKNGLPSLTGPTPALAPTFSSIRSQILEASDSSGRPACISCHNTSGRTPIDLVSSPYDALVNRRSTEQPALNRVTPGDPESSYIIHKLEGRPGITGQRMPRGGPYLTDGQIQIVRRWIQLGARND